MVWSVNQEKSKEYLNAFNAVYSARATEYFLRTLSLHMPTVQKGSVFSLRTNETASVIWSTNETWTSTYSIPLALMGWYTISLFGSLVYNEEDQQVGLDMESRARVNLTNDTRIWARQKSWGELCWHLGDFYDYYWSLVVCWSASLTMMHRGAASPFIITTSALQGK